MVVRPVIVEREKRALLLETVMKSPAAGISEQISRSPGVLSVFLSWTCLERRRPLGPVPYPDRCTVDGLETHPYSCRQHQ